MPDFVANNITKEYPTPAEPLKILAGVDVELNRGQSLAVVGPSGSGKSTFLQIAGTLDQPTSGTLTLLDQNLIGLNEKQLAKVRKPKPGLHLPRPSPVASTFVVGKRFNPSHRSRCCVLRIQSSGQKVYWIKWACPIAPTIGQLNFPAANDNELQWPER